MWDINWLNVIFAVLTLSVSVIVLPTFCFPNGTPKIIEHLYRLGKINEVATSRASSFLSGITEWLLVPKRYFTHFYVFASLYYIFLTIMLFSRYFCLTTVPTWFVSYLDCLASSNRAPTAEYISVIAVQILILCQALRRCYESLFVSVFSPSRMNVLHYCAGIAFYFSLGTSVIALAPGFTKEGLHVEVNFKDDSWKWYQLLGVVIYFWAAAHQFKCGKILANLRKNESGDVVTNQYKLPEGDWFYYVSCPHFLAEILVYLSINIVMKFSNHLIILTLVFTCVNQCCSAILDHQWYLDKFKENYPKNRKAIIPYVL